MPRKVPQETLNRWRQMDAEGKSLKAIGRATGWDPRTISTHLKREIHFEEPDEIRRDLFKEGLKEHWGLLIRETVTSLKRTTAPDPWAFIREVSLPAPTTFQANGAEATVAAAGEVRIRGYARKERATELLAQHIPTDSLWRALNAWERAVAADFQARRKLYDLGARKLVEVSRLPLEAEETTARPKPEAKESALLPGAAQLVFDMALGRAFGSAGRERRAEACAVAYDGVVECSSYRIARPPQGMGPSEVFAFVTQAVGVAAESGEARKAVEAIRTAEDATVELHRILEDLRLLIYLPRVCDVCARFSVRPSTATKGA